MRLLSLPPWVTQASPCLLFLGFSSHWYFASGEWDTHIWKPLLTFSLLQPIIWVVMIRECDPFDSALALLILDLSFLIPLFSSIVIYRLFFHRLCKFPGAFWPRLSMFWKMKKMKMDQFRLDDELHAKYGDVVRLGMDAISESRSKILENLNTLQVQSWSRSIAYRPLPRSTALAPSVVKLYSTS
jgi:hypothetical protein